MDRVDRIMALFAGHAGAHGTHGEPTHPLGSLKWEIKSTARTLRGPVTRELWELHLDGTRPLGVIPIMEDGNCWWGSIDIDRYDEDMLEVVRKVVGEGLPLVPCRSKSGGLHLWLFLESPQPAGTVQAVLRDVAAKLGLAGSEVFPKQAQVLSSRGDLGNWIIMPYFGSTYDGRLCEQVGLTPQGDEMDLDRFIEAAEAARVPPSRLVTLASRQGAKPAQRQNSGSGPDLVDGPICLQHLAAKKVEEHEGRNNALLMFGMYLKRKYPGDWRKRLEDLNQQYMSPPLQAAEVAMTVRSLDRKDYEYTCKAEPMASYCNSTLCMARKYGVGGDGRWPSISGMSKLRTTPTIWFVDVEGERLEITTDVLQNYYLFQRECMERLGVTFRTLTQGAWLQIVEKAMEDHTAIDVPAEVSVRGRFLEMMEDFLTNRQRGLVKEDMLSGRPWYCEEDGKHYFRLRDLQRFLEREDFRDETGKRPGRAKIVVLLQSIKAGHHFFILKGKGTNVWWVFDDVVQETPPAPVPEVRGSPV